MFVEKPINNNHKYDKIKNTNRNDQLLKKWSGLFFYICIIDRMDVFENSLICLTFLSFIRILCTKGFFAKEGIYVSEYGGF